ncbi:hypothetical protein D1AOALGA4SA_6631 [Olavius algarvensis Delta 1 endosymbiont]|nr:hypothetical protein D1AOALGA4SA_6631 [Olavius algarvensis Delta 1 endosymbiont]
MTERSESTLRHSIFDILRFCGSLLMKFPMNSFVVSYSSSCSSSSSMLLNCFQFRRRAQR